MDFLLTSVLAVEEQQGGISVEFLAALASLATAIIVTFGPAVVRRWMPQDTTVSDIAKNSTATIADSLDATLEIVRGDLAHMRTQIDDNGKKLDLILGAKRGTR